MNSSSPRPLTTKRYGHTLAPRSLPALGLVGILALGAGCPWEVGGDAPGAGGAGGVSYFRGSAAELEFDIPCAHLDVDATAGIAPNALVATAGGESQSTGHVFRVTLPVTAALLRDPGLPGDYGIVPYSGFSAGGPEDPTTTTELFDFTLKLKRPEGIWYACADACGSPGPSYNRVTNIVEVRNGGGTATFRISGELRARLAGIVSGEATEHTDFVGAWSLQVTVADPAPEP